MDARQTESTIDSVTLSVIDNQLVNICRQMGVAMMKTSYSPIFSEGLDFSCVIFNRDAEMIAQAEFCPAQLGAILYVVRWTIAEVGLENFHPGDVVLHNDPYRGGCHIPEHMVIKPVYFDDSLFGFVANIAHIAEIGGKAVGGFAADATDVYQEGLRLPPTKIMAAGDYVRDIWRIILTNHRTPRTTWGDLHAMIGSLHIAEQALMGLLRKYGTTFLNEAVQELIGYSERRMRAEIREIPDGEYSYEDCMEDDGVEDVPGWMRVTIVVRDDTIIADYTGTDPQRRGPVNATFGVTASATYNAVFHVTDMNIPRNSGCYRPIKIIAPPGSMLNVQHPAPEVGGNTETHPHIVDMVLGAFSKAVPERVAACSGGTYCNFLFGGVHPNTGEMYANYHFEGVGWGGTADHDGNSAQAAANGNCRNTPVEVFDTRYPFVTLEYRLVPDSGGAGKQRGGLGTRRLLRVVAPEIMASCLFDRMKTRPWGLFGGGEGGNSGVFLKRKGDTRFRSMSELFGTVSPSKFSEIRLLEGDEVLLQSSGGGGYGPPGEREADRVVEDVRERFVSVEKAAEAYGVALSADAPALDELP